MVVRFGGSRTGGEQLDLRPEKLDQAALAVRTTLVLIGTLREPVAELFTAGHFCNFRHALWLE
jgi:hypothetical protein